MVVHADGRIVGTIGGDARQAEMTWRARQAIDERRAQVASYELTADRAGEACSSAAGAWRIFIEPIEGTPTLCLFGAATWRSPWRTWPRRRGSESRSPTTA